MYLSSINSSKQKIFKQLLTLEKLIYILEASENVTWCFKLLTDKKYNEHFIFKDLSFNKNLQIIQNLINYKEITSEDSLNYMLVEAEQAVALKYGSEEKGFSLCKCSILLGFFMSKKQERLRSELLSEDKITNLLGFLT